MTRIIAGQYAGRRLLVPAAGSRPTTDRVREAVFNALSHRLGGWDGRRVLDLYAGSGALGLEALSRGAATATFVERDRSAAAVIRRNIAALAVGPRASLVVADAARWSPPAGTVFDVVLADPPYQRAAAEVAALLERLREGGACSPDALVVVERPSRDHVPPWPADWVLHDHRRYGETTVWYGRPQGEAADVEGT